MPEMKVAQLLEQFPELEEILIAMSPSFQKLRNPVLRRTVAKVATLRQVAKVGGISLSTLIIALRRAAGQEAGTFEDNTSGEAESQPSWFSAARVVDRFDARAVLESGGQPMGEVMGRLRNLGPGEIMELTTPFPPTPLIDMAHGKGYLTWSVREEPELVRTYFAAG
jgi:hypothetical protein